MIADLHPDWLVLRSSEVEAIIRQGGRPQLEKYEMANVFDASKRLDAYWLIPGKDYLQHDQTFYVLKRVRE